MKYEKVITALVHQYSRLDPAKLERNKAFGVIINARDVQDISLAEKSEDAIVITSEVLKRLGFKDNTRLEVSWDDLF